LANVTGLDAIGMPVYVAIRPNSRGLSVSQGKGIDRDSAKASAMMESIESWHGERVELPFRYDSYRALSQTEPVVDVTELPLRQGAILRTDVPMLFVEGYDLVEGRRTWIANESVTTNFVMPTRGSNTFFTSTNGLASGNHQLEAICHALCEVIERDALTMWNLKRPEETKERQLDLATITDPYCRQAIEQLERAGVTAAAWDITSDVGVPAYSSAIFERGSRPGWRQIGMFSGYGCHLSPAVALMRSLSEAVQSRLTMISGSRDDMFYADYRHCTNADDLQKMAWSVATPPATLAFSARSDLATESFDGDLAVLLERVRSVGIRSVAVADLTKPDIGIPVVKVVVPGLEAMSFAASYAPGKRARTRAAQMERGS
jgi:ribosomal protein S12 methylthiotransferase accessory factor